MRVFNKDALIMQQYVGSATAEDGTYGLTVSVNYSPIITFPSEEKVGFDWEDLIEQAKQYKKDGINSLAMIEKLEDELKAKDDQIAHLQASLQGYTDGCEEREKDNV